jgi:hypothetical protein
MNVLGHYDVRPKMDVMLNTGSVQRFKHPLSRAVFGKERATLITGEREGVCVPRVIIPTTLFSMGTLSTTGVHDDLRLARVLLARDIVCAGAVWLFKRFFRRGKTRLQGRAAASIAACRIAINGNGTTETGLSIRRHLAHCAPQPIMPVRAGSHSEGRARRSRGCAALPFMAIV